MGNIRIEVTESPRLREGGYTGRLTVKVTGNVVDIWQCGVTPPPTFSEVKTSDLKVRIFTREVGGASLDELSKQLQGLIEYMIIPYHIRNITYSLVEGGETTIEVNPVKIKFRKQRKNKK